MKQLIFTITLLIISITAFSQATDSVKTKEVPIKLNDMQKRAIDQFDVNKQNIEMQYKFNEEQRLLYLKSLIEGQGIDPTKVLSWKIEDGKLILTTKK